MQVHMACGDTNGFRKATCGVSEQDEPVLDWLPFTRYVSDWNLMQLEEDDLQPCRECLLAVKAVLSMLS